ncbi:MarR family winged helix-turn-helix transcriptional regulator [Amycolatopsis sp. NPDC059027]|uniref:MarR family winged helix-turn-helix transcriptional regulator n=1 Tax=unclassified Amycolatopsis TaxID=2618356 RepID=UPI00366A63B3
MPSYSRPAQPLTPAEETLFRTWLRAARLIHRAFDEDLAREQRMSLHEYSVLMHLSEAPERRLRMGELAAAVEMSLSGMTRLVTQLERLGFVERCRLESDGRGANAVLTDRGFARLEEAYPTHLASVRRHFVDHLDGLDIAELTRALDACADSTSA